MLATYSDVSSLHCQEPIMPINFPTIPEQNETLAIMDEVINQVIQSNYSSQLADNIFSLCQHLKISGPHLEQTHKSELNKTFIALRQASCRENGQLGTLCRLKMMEIVELRAMAWRPNLAHTQYYLNHSEHKELLGKKNLISYKNFPGEQNSLLEKTINAPILQNNFIHSSKLKTFPQFTVPPPPTLSTPVLPSSNPQMMFNQTNGLNPRYFLFPATSGWPTAQVIPNVSTTNTIMMQSTIPPPLPNLKNPIVAEYLKNVILNPTTDFLHSPYFLSNDALSSLINTPGIHRINAKSIKSQPYKEEIIIRNCDSGKIMGVRGRRVALVEELSKTVISFQKVEPKNKDRILTITGTTQQSIQYAKNLIDETIRKNTSEQKEIDIDKTEESKNEITIETTKDGILKLCCADPEMLQAAQEALSEYLNKASNVQQRSIRLTAEERALRKERRKSMPLQTGHKNPTYNPKSTTLPNTPIQ